MTDPLEKILQQTGLRPSLFPGNSRYHGIEMTSAETPDGETVACIRRRFVPQQDHHAVIREHTVKPEDRLDSIANQYFGDPEAYWRLCDANGVLCPEDLTRVKGSRIKITLPEGMPGFNHA